MRKEKKGGVAMGERKKKGGIAMGERKKKGVQQWARERKKQWEMKERKNGGGGIYVSERVGVDL